MCSKEEMEAKHNFKWFAYRFSLGVINLFMCILTDEWFICGLFIHTHMDVNIAVHGPLLHK